MQSWIITDLPQMRGPEDGSGKQTAASSAIRKESSLPARQRLRRLSHCDLTSLDPQRSLPAGGFYGITSSATLTLLSEEPERGPAHRSHRM